MIKVKDIAFVGYPVSDVARARKFYEETFGFKATMVEKFEGDKWWIEYDIGHGTLAITNTWKPSATSAPQIALEVEDLDAAVAFIRQKNIKIVLDTIPTPVCRFFVIADPDGNGIILHQHNK